MSGEPIGRYRVVRELGRGGMGVVYEAEEPELGRRVALKLLAPGAFEPDLVLRFSREAAALARVSHPNVLRVHGLESTPRGPCLVTELVAGEPLDALLARGPLAPAEAGRLVRALADAVAAVHAAGLLHRDLKPSNVLVREGGSPVLLDFGLARELDAKTLTRTGTLLGTPAYMAPEQARGARTHELEPRVDVYGLGAVLLACLTGRDPFAGAGPYEVLLQVIEEEPVWPAEAPPELVAVGRRAMAKRVEERFAGADELAHALDDALRGDAPAATVARPRALALGAAGALALGVALTTLAIRSRAREPERPLHEPPLASSPEVVDPAADGGPPPSAPPATREAPLVSAELHGVGTLAPSEGLGYGYVLLGERHAFTIGVGQLRALPVASGQEPWSLQLRHYWERPCLEPGGRALLLTGPAGVARVALSGGAPEPVPLAAGLARAKCLAFDEDGALAVGRERELVVRHPDRPELRAQLPWNPRELAAVGSCWVVLAHRDSEDGGGTLLRAFDRATLAERGELTLRMRCYGLTPVGDQFWLGTSKGQLLRYAMRPGGFERVGHLAPEGVEVRFDDTFVLPVPRAHDRPILDLALVHGGRALLVVVGDYWREPYGGGIGLWSLDTSALLAWAPSAAPGPVPIQLAARQLEGGRLRIAVLSQGLGLELYEASFNRE